MEPNRAKPKLISYIRFSTDLQITGDSLRRQLQASERYAKEHGLEVDEQFNLKDLGLSAFHGEHTKRGALGGFLKAVEQGRIPRGSVLLIESFDRLSREEMFIAVDTFMAIVRQGIKIVTLLDGREFTRESDYTDFFSLIAVLSRAHDESKTKSIRLKAAWSTKRASIEGGNKLTAKCPAWLKLDPRTRQFRTIPNRVKLIQQIFNLYLDGGNGVGTIVRILNKARVPSWRSERGWYASYIKKILHNRAVLGEFQPHVIDGKKRKPVGRPIEGYYPAIISEKVFYEAQDRLKAHATGRGGRTGKVNNLFAHVARCGECGAPMAFVDKGKGDSQRYLTCDSARRGKGCQRVSFNYREFEQAFLRTCLELDVKAILPSDHDSVVDVEIIGIDEKITRAVGELRGNENQRANLIDILKDSTDDLFREDIKKDLKTNHSERKRLEEEIAQLTARRERLMSAEKQAEDQRRGIIELIEMLDTTTGDDLIGIRQRLRAEIRRLVKRIQVFPQGLQGRTLSWNASPDTHPPQWGYTDIRETEAGCEPDEYDNYLKATTGKEHRRFGVFFNLGGFRELVCDGGELTIGAAGKDWQSVYRSVLAEAGIDRGKARTISKGV